MRYVRWIIVIVIIILGLFITGTVWAQEGKKKQIDTSSDLIKEIKYIKDVHGFKLYEIIPKPDMLRHNVLFDYNFCGDKIMIYSDKYIFLIDLDSKSIFKSIKISKNLTEYINQYNVNCDETGRFIFLSSYVYDTQSETFLNLSGSSDMPGIYLLPVYFYGGFIISSNKEGPYKVFDKIFYFLPYRKIETLTKDCPQILEIQKDKNNEISIISGNKDKICQVNLNQMKTKVIYKGSKDINMKDLQLVDGVFYFYDLKGYDMGPFTAYLYRLSLDNNDKKLELLKIIDRFAGYIGLDKNTIIYGTEKGNVAIIEDKKENILYKVESKFVFPLSEEDCSYCFKRAPNSSGVIFRTKKAIVILVKSGK